MVRELSLAESMVLGSQVNKNKYFFIFVKIKINKLLLALYAS
jgi:hypothetical protein